MAMEHSVSLHSRLSSFSQSAILTTSTGNSNVGVKIGGLWKRSQGISRFTKANYKHRVFILTEQSLSYYAGKVDRVGQLKGRLSTDCIRAVEFVDFSAFNLAHTIQIVHYSKKSGFVGLYVTATDNAEAGDWVSALRQACYFNKDMLMHYHPGAFLKNKWSCCKQRGRVMLGCQPTYHLLTRSSSRYAQMRRKDTLTNKLNRPRHNSGTSVYSTVDRQSTVTCDSINVMDVNGVPHTLPGQGLSNSCVDLTVHPPHRINSFIIQQDPSSNRRSSRLSTEPSYGVNSTVLNRISFASGSRPPSGSGSEIESSVEGAMKRGSSQSLKRRSRSQVAPETAPVTPHSNFPAESLSLEGEIPESPLVYNSSRSTSKSVDTNTLQLSSSPSDHSHDSDHEPSPPPIPPPRQKHGPSGLTQSNSIHFVPRVTPISEANSPPSLTDTTQTPTDFLSESMPVSPRAPVKSTLKHSNTFVVQRPVVRRVDPDVVSGRKVEAKLRALSHSMSALSKPMIEPKVSSSNPNVIHV